MGTLNYGCWRTGAAPVPFCSNHQDARVKNKLLRPHSGLRLPAVLGTALLIGLLSGCASTATRDPSASQRTDAYVTGQMSQTIESVDESLRELVALSRGDAGPRKRGFIGDTVAGAAGPDHAAPRMPERAQLDTPLGQRQEQERLNYNRLALQTRVKAVWNGQVNDLLRQLAPAIHYQFVEVGAGELPTVHMNQPSATVEDVLGAAAKQIQPKAAIKVLTGPRQICLVHGDLNTPCPPASDLK